MRIMRYARGGVSGVAVSNDGIQWDGIDDPGQGLTAADMFAEGPASLAHLASRIRAEGGPIDLDDIEFLPPVPNPDKVLCIGLNYAAHVAELGMAIPTHPTVFVRFGTSIVGHGARLVCPHGSEQFDYEAELAVIIGSGGRHIARDKALDHVAGYSLFNDGSVRDHQLQTTQWTMGKNHDATGSFGPWIVTPDELPAGCAGLPITGTLNGAQKQAGSTDNLVFDVPQLIAKLSAVMTLNPGDVIVTGTPSGVAMGDAEPRWLRPGDWFEVSIPGIGTLSNPVVAR